MYKKIDDYGVIGNFHSIALVGLDGSIDWCCLPYLDSPSIFAAILDQNKGGHFSICPTGEWDSIAKYIRTTNILATSFRTRTGSMVLTDFMPVIPENDSEKKNIKSRFPELYRMVQVTSGEIEVLVDYRPRFDYGRAQTMLQERDCSIFASGGGKKASLCCNRPGLRVEGDRAVARWNLKKGDYVWVNLHYNQDICERFDPEEGGKTLRMTEAFWHKWLRQTETGYNMELGYFQPLVERSALVLKLLQYRPTGAIAAAATTSLPEEVGGVRNWDYRFSWVRDTALTLEALFNLGHISETEQYLRWIEKIISERGAGLEVLYDLQGEKVLSEESLDHLEGYKGSAPVRVGNAAVQQKQLDIYGEIMDSAYKLSQYIGKIDLEFWYFLRDICETVRKRWKEKDCGIWEVRGGEYHFVLSKVMCWVAMERGIAIAVRYGFPAELEAWRSPREEIRQEVMEKGWNEEKKAFVQHYDTDALDAGVLLLPIFDFIPYDDPRMLSTVEAIRRELGNENFIYRYRVHQSRDGLPGSEGIFLVCTFWLIRNLIGQGKLDEAEMLLHRTEKTSNHLGLFSEEWDPHWKTALGNFPQAFTHIGYINCVIALFRRRAETSSPEKEQDLSEFVREKLLITSEFLLNDGKPRKELDSKEVVPRMKHLMNLMQGSFYQSAAGGVAYEKMKKSDLFRDYLECSYHLQNLDLDKVLTTRKKDMAFWINLYNVMVIHGVIALDIRNSVKEVPRFFRRIKYRIEGVMFSADDIEHGILRNNRRLPNSLFRPFGDSDSRNRFRIDPPDPRVHFALVCATRSCPPIDIYTAEKLDEQLDVAARTFLNAGGVEIDREKAEVRLSEIFSWYGEDFGEDLEKRLERIASYLYQEEDRRYLRENGSALLVKYQDYDWRLNRT